MRRRRAAGLPSASTDSYRVVHGAADGLPGLFVDRFGDQVQVRLRDPQWTEGPARRALLEALLDEGLRGLRWVIDHPGKHAGPRDAALARAWNLELEARGVAACSERRPCRELGFTYEVCLHEPFSPGLFLDMREVRASLRERWRDRRILNLFSYTCPFSVVLAEHNEVTNVDVSARYLDWGRDNHRRNGLDVEDRGTRFVQADAFTFLQEAIEARERFDALILDPPVSSRGRSGHSKAFALRKDFGRLVEDALSLLTDKGELFVSTNYEALSQDAFRRLVVGIARDRQRWIAHQWGPGPDFPVSPSAYHLKSALLVHEKQVQPRARAQRST